MSSVATRTSRPLNVESNDAGLVRNIQRALADTGYMPLRTVEIKVHEGLVTLKGQVPTYYLKQMAQTAAMRHQTVEMLQNDIEVVSTDSLRGQLHDT